MFPVCVNKNYIGGFRVKREKGQKGWRRDIVRARTRQQHMDTGRWTLLTHTQNLHRLVLELEQSSGMPGLDPCKFRSGSWTKASESDNTSVIKCNKCKNMSET